MLIESSKVQNVKVLVLPQAALENTFIYLLSNTLVTSCESQIYFFTFLPGRLPFKLPSDITLNTILHTVI